MDTLMNAISDFCGAHPAFTIVVAMALLVVITTIVLGARGTQELPADEMTKLTQSSPEVKHRIWSHNLHEDSVFNARHNFFLLFEGVLFGALGALIASKAVGVYDERFVVVFGVAVTLLWFYAQAREFTMVTALKKRNRGVFDEYKWIVDHRNWWPLGGSVLIAYGLPLVILCGWIASLAFLEGWHLGL